MTVNSDVISTVLDQFKRMPRWKNSRLGYADNGDLTLTQFKECPLSGLRLVGVTTYGETGALTEVHVYTKYGRLPHATQGVPIT